jgi:hypothetical protein
MNFLRMRWMMLKISPLRLYPSPSHLGADSRREPNLIVILLSRRRRARRGGRNKSYLIMSRITNNRNKMILREVAPF